MLKTIPLFTLVLKSTISCAQIATPGHVVDAGTTKAVLYDNTLSPDGFFGVGWTLLPQNAAAKPIDWSRWDPNNVFSICPASFGDETTKNYRDATVLIDLKRRAYIELPSDQPDYPHENRGYMVVRWCPASGAAHWALIQNDSRWYTDNLWLVTIDGASVKQADLARKLDAALAPVLREKRPIMTSSYGTFYLLQGYTWTKEKFRYADGTVEIPFQSDIPKSLDTRTMFEGKINVRLVDGSIQGISTTSDKFDPFVADRKLAEADRKLNLVYAELRTLLDPAGQTALRKEQVEWLSQRDAAATDAIIHNENGDCASLLDWTQKRTSELSARMENLK